jgi:hypothetical protein
MVSEKQNTLTYLNVNNLQKFKFDQLITSHKQVEYLTDRLIHKFLYPRGKHEKDKIMLNISDQFDSNNNAGFNLTNFKVKFINQFFQDVINDYEKSIIGTFSKGLLESINQDDQMRDSVEIFFTITKFDNDYGYSLIHQESGDVTESVMSLEEAHNRDITSNHMDGSIIEKPEQTTTIN